jgi:hypothetical protein
MFFSLNRYANNRVIVREKREERKRLLVEYRVNEGSTDEG